MKIPAKIYAQVLYQLTTGRSENEIKEIVKDFFSILVVNRDLKKINEVIGQFIKIWNTNANLVEAEVKCARELKNNNILQAISEFIAAIAKVKQVNLTQKIEEDILGGVIINFRDQVFDFSLKDKLQNLKNRMLD